MENTSQDNRKSTSPTSAPTDNRSDVVVNDDETVEVEPFQGRNSTLIPDGNTHNSADEGVLDLPSNTTTIINQDINQDIHGEEANDEVGTLLNNTGEFTSQLTISRALSPQEQAEAIQHFLDQIPEVLATSKRLMEASRFWGFLEAERGFEIGWREERSAWREAYWEFERIADNMYPAEERVARQTELAEERTAQFAHYEEQLRFYAQRRRGIAMEMQAGAKKSFNVVFQFANRFYHFLQSVQQQAVDRELIVEGIREVITRARNLLIKSSVLFSDFLEVEIDFENDLVEEHHSWMNAYLKLERVVDNIHPAEEPVARQAYLAEELAAQNARYMELKRLNSQWRLNREIEMEAWADKKLNEIVQLADQFCEFLQLEDCSEIWDSDDVSSDDD